MTVMERFIPQAVLSKKSEANSNKRLKNTKFNSEHTAFLIEQIDKNPCITTTDVL